MTYNPKNILITGGCGFIGSNFIHYLLAENSEVTLINLDALTYAGALSNVEGLDPNRYQFVHGDITDEVLVARYHRALCR